MPGRLVPARLNEDAGCGMQGAGLSINQAGPCTPHPASWFHVRYAHEVRQVCASREDSRTPPRQSLRKKLAAPLLIGRGLRGDGGPGRSLKGTARGAIVAADWLRSHEQHVRQAVWRCGTHLSPGIAPYSSLRAGEEKGSVDSGFFWKRFAARRSRARPRAPLHVASPWGVDG